MSDRYSIARLALQEFLLERGLPLSGQSTLPTNVEKALLEDANAWLISVHGVSIQDLVIHSNTAEAEFDQHFVGPQNEQMFDDWIRIAEVIRGWADFSEDVEVVDGFPGNCEISVYVSATRFEQFQTRMQATYFEICKPITVRVFDLDSSTITELGKFVIANKGIKAIKGASVELNSDTDLAP